MSNDRGIPTVRDIRFWAGVGETILPEEFDRWLAEYTRQQREEAWDQGVRTAFGESVETYSWTPSDLVNPHREETP